VTARVKRTTKRRTDGVEKGMQIMEIGKEHTVARGQKGWQKTMLEAKIHNGLSYLTRRRRRRRRRRKRKEKMMMMMMMI
jgi:hypothetical protein